MAISLNLQKREPTSKSVSKLALLAASWYLLYWVNDKFWDRLLFQVINLSPDSKIGESVRFFFYDSTKILLLLTGITFVVTMLRSFITIERTRAFLGGKRQGVGNIVAASAGGV